MTAAAAPLAAAADRCAYALGLGDDALVLAQRLMEWSAHAPTLEEDLALENIALDLLGQARHLLTYAGAVEGRGRDEDRLAYWRDDGEFRNLQLVEQPNGDFAATMVRQWLFSTYQRLLYQALRASADADLAGLGERGAKEAAYHLDHAGQWVRRLGDGTAESHQRTQAAVDQLWPFVAEMFAGDPVEARLVAAGVAGEGSVLRPAFDAAVDAVLVAATLCRPEAAFTARGGRTGHHTEHLGHLLAE
ncbi:MAG TPA: 1,2-phenylacetyl-CoA epoxidase subunit PaaC, partial [Candidatus Dormibacteraeota bacterium]|nr:1,2-phenylacetyl-CoA epoxidase subunit PaaC [Candidatus Dormibacteraeota bacterium]